MNIVDIIVIAIILVFFIRGFLKGFVYSIFDVASYIIAAFVALKYNKPLTEAIKKTVVYEKINETVTNFISNNFDTSIKVSDTDINMNVINKTIQDLSIPDSTKKMIMDTFQNNEAIGTNIVESLSNGFTNIILTIISIILIFIAVKIVMSIIAFILDKFMSLPILNSLNRFFGGVVGIVSGIIVIYIVCAIFTMLNITQYNSELAQLIDSSWIAKKFFYNNLILKFLYKI